ncbi:3D domain-containing protein [Priestia sp. SB1]|uniref:3D domain-containing protein n=1 Tax=Priestia sp. SB1 TaxID=3132359 RepID=UPI003179BA16
MNLKDKITYIKYNKNKIIIKIFVTSAILGLTGITLDSKLIITTRDKQITELKSKHKNQVEDLEENINLLDKQYDVLQDKLDSKTDAYDKAAKENEELHNQNEKLEAANEKLKKEVENFQEKRKESDQSSKNNKSKQIINNEDKKVKNDENEISRKEGFYSNPNSEKQLLGTYELTFYTNHQQSTGKSEGDPDYGITSSGVRTRAGVTIACPPEIPSGTQLEIESIGIRTCQDKGGDIRNQRLDIYVESEAEAMRLGRQHKKVYKLNN